MQSDILSHLLDFLKAPEKTINHEFTKQKFAVIAWKMLQLTSVSIVLAIAALLLSSVVSSWFGYNQSGDNQVGDFLTSYPLYQAFLIVVVVGPFMEEFGFRLFVSKKKWAFLIGCGLLGFQFLNFITTILASVDKSIIENIWFGLGLLGSFILLFLAVILSGFLVSKERIKNLVTKRARFLVWFSVVFFGFVHLGNYANGVKFFYLAPLLVAPQLIAGVAFVFMRVRYNIWWAFATHALYNFILSFSLFVYAIFGVGDELDKILNNLNSGKVDLSPNLISANLTLFALYFGVLVIAMYTISKFLLVRIEVKSKVS